MAGLAVSGTESKAIDQKPLWSKAHECRIAKKANLKAKGGNVYGRKGWGSKISQFLGEGRSAAVIGKAYHESNHYVQAALIRKQFEAGGELDLRKCIDDMGVKDRVYREDYIRFRPDMFLSSEVNKVAKRNHIATRLSRAAHCLHGICEIAAAPTGFLQNGVKNLTVPDADPKGMTNRSGMLVSLLPIGMAVTAVPQVLTTQVPALAAPAFLLPPSSGALPVAVGALPMAFSAVSSASGGLSAAFGLLSQAVLVKEDLNNQQKAEIVKDNQLLLIRLDALLKNIRRGTQGHSMLGVALNRKIGTEFRDKATGEPELLKALTLAYDSSASQEQRLKNIGRIVGQYLSVPERARASKKGVLDQIKKYQLAKELREKESHFVALCSLVEHLDLLDSPGSCKDLRKSGEELLDKFHHKILAPGAQIALRILPGFKDSKVDQFLTDYNSEGYKERQQKKLQREYARGEHISSLGRILSHHHQYSKSTVFCARVGEALRRISLDIILAQNGQLSRAFFNVFFRANKLIGTSPASRMINVGLGRFAGGAVLTAIWVTLTVLTAGAFSALNVAAISGTGLNIGATSLSVIAIGSLMFGFVLVGFGFSLAAKAMAATGGYKGGSAKHMPSILEDSKAAGWNQNSRLSMVKSSNLKPLYRLIPGAA